MIWIASALVLLGFTLVYLVPYFIARYSKATNVKPAIPQYQAYAAELVSATGVVLLRKSDQAAWQEVKTGARLMERDMIRTDDSGGTSIRYSNGTVVFIQPQTIFTVQKNGSDRMQISAPTEDVIPESRNAETTLRSSEGLEGAKLGEAKAGELPPSIVLQGIIPFGRSLELIGRIEAGSSLVVNDESVYVAGDGSFKHFTNPFPLSAREARLVLKVTNLAGRTRILTAAYDFRTHRGGN